MVLSNSQWLANPGVTYEIDQSIRFNDDDEAHLYNTSFSASPTSSTDCTFSVWVKRGSNFGSNSNILYGGDPNGSTSESLRFGTGNQLQFSQASSDYDLKTTQVFRDPSAWYHIVAVLDTNNGTESSRAALYVNGSKVTDFATENYPSSSYSTNFTSGASDVVHTVGANAFETVGPDSQHFDGYLAEINAIDGQALTPTSFGEFNSDTGQWTPKKYEGSYGTNGYYLKGENSSDLGNDSSGNGNDFTSSGLAANDQVTDSPTNNFWTLNPLDSGSTLANGNLQNKGGNSTNTHAPAFPTTGKWYMEITCTDINTGTTGAHFFGICDASVGASQSFSDHATISAGQQRGGQLKKNNSNSSTGTAVNDGDVLALAFDADNLTLDLYVNNSQSGSQITGLTDVTYKLWIQDGAAVTNMQVNFGQTGGFTYTPPTGFSALSTANLPDPTIADPSAHFQSVQYATNTSAQDITFGGNSDLAPDWLWFKSRSTASDHFWFDKVRGVLKTLSSNDTTAEETSTGSLTAFGSDGFSLGDGGSNNDINGASSSANFMAWGWAAGGTSGSSNDDGSITSTVSANSTSGFSIIRWTGTAANGTIGHGLGAQPSLYILKNTATTNSWIVGSTLYAATAYLSINSTDALATGDAAVFNSTHPTSSVINLGSNVGTNGSSGSNNMICYAFAEVPGFSKIGSYVGNGSADGPYVTTGFKPAWILVKNTGTAGTNWDILDSIREPFNSVGNQIFANRTDAEASNDHEFDFLSNGFKLRDNSSSVNQSGKTFIYMAFAETPFKTATAR